MRFKSSFLTVSGTKAVENDDVEVKLKSFFILLPRPLGTISKTKSSTVILSNPFCFTTSENF
jgi:hypothetical protein